MFVSHTRSISIEVRLQSHVTQNVTFYLQQFLAQNLNLTVEAWVATECVTFQTEVNCLAKIKMTSNYTTTQNITFQTTQLFFLYHQNSIPYNIHPPNKQFTFSSFSNIRFTKVCNSFFSSLFSYSPRKSYLSNTYPSLFKFKQIIHRRSNSPNKFLPFFSSIGFLYLICVCDTKIGFSSQLIILCDFNPFSR